MQFNCQRHLCATPLLLGFCCLLYSVCLFVFYYFNYLMYPFNFNVFLGCHLSSFCAIVVLIYKMYSWLPETHKPSRLFLLLNVLKLFHSSICIILYFRKLERNSIEVISNGTFQGLAGLRIM